MLSRIIVKVFYKIGVFTSYIFGIKLNNYAKLLRNTCYSGWIEKTSKSFKGQPYIEYPIILFGQQYITIGDNFFAHKRLRIEAWDRYLDNIYTPQINIGNNVSINYDCHIAAINKVTIGNNVLIGSRVFITDHFHGSAQAKYLDTIPKERELTTKGPVVIEDNVWIGEGVCIMPNITIGKNAIIGANAVVTHNVPANSYAVGIPAKNFPIQ
jgi:acetyltransferase-like isoleucine patch superfamily enzyme